MKGENMAKVTLIPGIASISGRIGDWVFRTSKATGQVTVSLRPRKVSKRPKKTER